MSPWKGPKQAISDHHNTLRLLVAGPCVMLRTCGRTSASQYMSLSSSGRPTKTSYLQRQVPCCLTTRSVRLEAQAPRWSWHLQLTLETPANAGDTGHCMPQEECH